MNLRRIKNIIEALEKHSDADSTKALCDIGTNCSMDEIRVLVAQALVRKNTSSSLDVVIAQAGKGINDLSATVAMNTINELLSLKNKEEAMRILDRTIKTSDKQEVIDTARSTKALMSFSS